jgi:hypothetical protein
MKETIFYLEERGGQWIYHFFIYNLGGLYYILKDKSNIVSKPSKDINFPIKIYMQNLNNVQRETFELIKDKFILLDKLPSDDNC